MSDTHDGNDGNEWEPVTNDIRTYFILGVGLERAFGYAIIRKSILKWDKPEHVFDEWLKEHDRQISEKSYREGYSSGWYRGWDDDGDNCCPDNPYRKEQS